MIHLDFPQFFLSCDDDDVSHTSARPRLINTPLPLCSFHTFGDICFRSQLHSSRERLAIGRTAEPARRCYATRNTPSIDSPLLRLCTFEESRKYLHTELSLKPVFLRVGREESRAFESRESKRIALLWWERVSGFLCWKVEIIENILWQTLSDRSEAQVKRFESKQTGKFLDRRLRTINHFVEKFPHHW